MRRLLALVLLLAGLAAPFAARAHEVRPAYLEIQQTGPADYAVTWKQPTMGELAIHLAPHLSAGWLEGAPEDQYGAGGYLIRVWRIHSATPVAGQTVNVEGLADTITDVLVRVAPLKGPSSELILHPEAPSAVLTAGEHAGPPWSFLPLGMRHILSGPDHLLFVLGLILMVRNRMALLKTVTAFTAAHSLTLAAATLGYIHVPGPLVDALIALSIMFVAPEALRAQRGGDSFTIRRPWIVAFCFGLLHGVGFASGLSTVGLSGGALAGALLLFNLGVEAGQLVFIAAVLGAYALLRPLIARLPAPARLGPAYAIGMLGAMWVMQNVGVLIGLWPPAA